MAKITLTTEQSDILRTASDILLRNTGASYLKDLASLYEKLKSQDSDFDDQDIKLIQLLCDVALKASGIAQLKHVVAILTMTVNFEKLLS